MGSEAAEAVPDVGHILRQLSYCSTSSKSNSTFKTTEQFTDLLKAFYNVCSSLTKYETQVLPEIFLSTQGPGILRDVLQYMKSMNSIRKQSDCYLYLVHAVATLAEENTELALQLTRSGVTDLLLDEFTAHNIPRQNYAAVAAACLRLVSQLGKLDDVSNGKDTANGKITKLLIDCIERSYSRQLKAVAMSFLVQEGHISLVKNLRLNAEVFEHVLSFLSENSDSPCSGRVSFGDTQICVTPKEMFEVVHKLTSAGLWPESSSSALMDYASELIADILGSCMLDKTDRYKLLWSLQVITDLCSSATISTIFEDCPDMFTNLYHIEFHSLFASEEVARRVSNLRVKISQSLIEEEAKCGHICESTAYKMDDTAPFDIIYGGCPHCSGIVDMYHSLGMYEPCQQNNCDHLSLPCYMVDMLPAALKQGFGRLRYHGQTILSKAARLQDVDMVKFALEDCNPNTDQSEELGLLLWSASGNGHGRIVEELVNHGAPVDAPNVRNRCTTPLHVACSGAFCDVVQFLIGKGAKVNVKDLDSVTPLMVSLKHLPVCEILVDSGADVSAEVNGNDVCAMAACVMEPHKDSIKVLDLIVDKRSPEPVRSVQLYNILGGELFDNAGDIEGAKKAWKKAIDIRNANNIKEGLDELAGQYGVDFVVDSSSQLSQLEFGKLAMRSLWLREKILGPGNECTITCLTGRAEMYTTLDKQTHNYQAVCFRTMQAWHDFERSKVTGLLHVRCGKLLDTLSFLLLEKQGGTQFRTILEMTILEAGEIAKNGCSHAFQTESSMKEQDELITNLMLVCVRLLIIFCRGDDKCSEDEHVRDCLKKLVAMKPRNSLGQTLLHFSVKEYCRWYAKHANSPVLLDPDQCVVQYDVSKDNDVIYVPSLEAIQTLLDWGLDVNAMDQQRTTPLQHAIDVFNAECMDASMAVDQRIKALSTVSALLIKRGAHVDIRGPRGRRASVELKAVGVSCNDVLSVLKLKCLAAQYVYKCGISYKHLPQFLAEFIDLH